MKRILITGGSGFLGAWTIRHLLGTSVKIRALAQGGRRNIVDLVLGDRAEQVEWVVGDISRPEVMREAARDCDTIIHLAAFQLPACQEDPARGAAVNVIGTINVFEAARQHGITSVTYVSTASVFGPDGSACPSPTTHYGAFKLANEGSARAYWSNHKVSSVGLRPFVLYGPGRDVGLSAGISLACRAASRGEPYTIGLTGLMDFVYVEDLACAIAAIVTSPPTGAHVFAVAGEIARIEDVVEQINGTVPGARISAQGPNNPTAPTRTGIDVRSAINEIPTTGLAEGIRRTIEFFSEKRITG